MSQLNTTTESSYLNNTTVEGTLGYDKLLKQHFEYRLSLDLYIYVIPILVILGCTGNCLSFLVTRRPRMRQLPICVIISVLAFADSGVLLFSAVRYWIGKVSGHDLKMLSNVTCKIFGGFVYHFVRHYASWLVVLIAATRSLIVFMPLKTSSLVTVRVVKLTCCIVGIVLACIDASLFWMYELIQDPIETDGKVVYQKRCFIRGSMRFVWPWVDFMLYSLVPMILLTAFSAALSIRVIITLRNRKRLFQIPALPSVDTPMSSQGRSMLSIRASSDGGMAPPDTVELTSARRPDLLQLPERRGPALGSRLVHVAPLQQDEEVRNNSNEVKSTTERKQSSISSDWRQSMMPIIISVFFIFYTSCITGMEIIYSDITDMEPKYMAKIRLTRTCFFLLMYSNHSINFALYLLSGRNFREETLAFFRRRE